MPGMELITPEGIESMLTSIGSIGLVAGLVSLVIALSVFVEVIGAIKRVAAPRKVWHDEDGGYWSFE